ncbi:hypothetical protein [Haladaptatus caseinilyticus]|uniref:hypothetical protein n=1 Tax=Haladaptatus caseinilyticus TaxID=2993314 RepID=UPI00224B9AEE|nr:hypothetical protein [Haladaptatus caseinilyticus]
MKPGSCCLLVFEITLLYATITIPGRDHALEGLREAIGDNFEGKFVDELRQEGRDQAVDDAENDVRRD